MTEILAWLAVGLASVTYIIVISKIDVENHKYDTVREHTGAMYMMFILDALFVIAIIVLWCINHIRVV